MRMVDYAVQATSEYVKHMPKSLRKNYGQFFTSKETALFMAELFTIPLKDTISILDPGAGSGMLSAALIERLQTIKHIKEIELVCCENDPNVGDTIEKDLVKNVTKLQELG